MQKLVSLYFLDQIILTIQTFNKVDVSYVSGEPLDEVLH